MPGSLLCVAVFGYSWCCQLDLLWEGRKQDYGKRPMTMTDTTEEMTPAYARHVGERLRNIRRQQGLSLQAVEEQSEREFKASVSVPMKEARGSSRSCACSGWHACTAFPSTSCCRRCHRNRTSGPKPRTGPGAGPITIDLSRLEHLDAPEREVLRRYIGMIQIQRGDFNGRLITIRSEDVRALARVFNATSTPCAVASTSSASGPEPSRRAAALSRGGAN